LTTDTIVVPRNEVSSAPPRPRGRGTRQRRTAAWYVAATVVALVFVLPFLLLVVTVFKTTGGAARTPPSYLPHPVSLENFRSLFLGGTDLGRYVGNSLLVACLCVAITVVLTVLGGYGFARFSFPARAVAFAFMLTIFMVPFQSILTPLYIVLLHLHLLNSLLGLGLVYATYQLPFGLFIMRNSFSTIPAAIYEAAEVDGAGHAIALWRIHIPLVVPGIVTVALFAFIASWNEFLGALILLSNQSNFTLPVELLTLVTGQFGVIDWGLLEAGVVVTMVPCIIVFLVLQRYYLGGILSGAVK
jgi:multiple sugar transport system permease protein